ncbi:hypothetical protein BD626DRAFT_424255, partial [Schizophyllum amplum]
MGALLRCDLDGTSAITPPSAVTASLLIAHSSTLAAPEGTTGLHTAGTVALAVARTSLALDTTAPASARVVVSEERARKGSRQQRRASPSLRGVASL